MDATERSARTGGESSRWYVVGHRTPSNVARRWGRDAGVAVDSLAAGTRLFVRTETSDYQLVVVGRRRVLARGGRYLPEPAEATVQGSSDGGCLLKTGWIGVGLRLELVVNRRRIVTSRVQSIVAEDAEATGAEFRILG